MFYGLGLREHVLSGGFAETFFFLYDNDSIQSKSRTCKQIITGSFRQVKNNIEINSKFKFHRVYSPQKNELLLTFIIGEYS